MRTAPLIVTVIGDPSGVGPEVCVKALATGIPQAEGRTLLVGSLHALQASAKVCGVDLRFDSVAHPEDAGHGAAVSVLDPGNLSSSDYAVGSNSAACNRAALEWIRIARELAEQRRVAGWILAPVNDKALRLASDGASSEDLEPAGTFQFRISGPLRVVPISEHVRMREIAEWVKQGRILQLVRLVDESLKRWGIPAPRIAVAGLNPHAMFEEDAEEIEPAVREARRVGIDAMGPVSPDAVFRQAREGVFDAVVTMYHDQGQIALKTAAFAGACTVFLGLPYVRIGIPHGTAYDIAGTGKAQHLTMLAAMRTAAALSSGRGFPSVPLNSR